MKLYVQLILTMQCIAKQALFTSTVATPITIISQYRLMSDYEVTLVDGKMSEFFVKFHGPAESKLCLGTQHRTVP